MRKCLSLYKIDSENDYYSDNMTGDLKGMMVLLTFQWLWQSVCQKTPAVLHVAILSTAAWHAEFDTKTEQITYMNYTAQNITICKHVYF